MKYRILIAMVAALLAGCASNTIGPERDINDPTSSLVFAYVDMKDAPTSIGHASLRQAAPKGEEGYWGMTVEDGMLFSQYIPTGSFQLEQFGGSGFWAGDVRYSFPTYGRNETAISIKKPGIHFLGAFQYKKVKTGFFEQGKFDVERVSSPSETELLTRILGMKWVKGTQWEGRIRNRLAELRK